MNSCWGQRAAGQSLVRQALTWACAMQEDWQDAESHVEKAHELFDRGKWEAALKELRAAIRTNPYNHLWHFDMGVMLDQLGRFDEAVTAFRKAVDLQADDIESLNALGIDLTRTGAPQAALECFERCEKLDSAYEPSYCNRIMAYSDLGDHDKAEQMFYLARQITDECPFCSFNLGESLYRRAQYDRAISCWKQVIRTDPDHGDVHYRLALAYWGKNDIRLARRHFREQLRRDPGHIDALLDLARLDLNRRPEAAREKFRFALELDPANAFAWSLLGEAEYRLGRMGRAEVALRRSLRMDPEQTWVRIGLAQIALDRGQADRVAELVREELALKHDQLDVLEQAADLARGAHHFDLARQAYLAMLAIDPKDVPANEGLAGVLVDLEQFAPAADQCRHTLELEPGSAEAMTQLAEALIGLGQFDEAQKLVTRGLTLHPDNGYLKLLRDQIPQARADKAGSVLHRLLTWRKSHPQR